MAGSRTSVWHEDDTSFLTPSEFIEVIQEEGFYKIRARLLSYERFNSNDYVGEKFYFGTPNFTIGYGILEEISTIGDFGESVT